ncbi:hypothetical protein HNQ07_004090 [Deinococcus metalli]|uniref:DUF6602 domain-containing protein n=1 Tax=Deinococcus metalli TaxID=1141878 RepID=A0A7W8KIV8_9DEIO|nr:DUF6602 domain-containing protein [Deinococcus metalli]MBB5378583.1 hypothetical protein [Deinococcus metalli]GHF58794.1 hypothetical protein GCM10017781_38870 [Deinococcus metalli]
MSGPGRLEDIYAAVNTRFVAELSAAQNALQHPTMKGDTTEAQWIEVLSTHLPARYRVGTGQIIDHRGAVSQQIDVVIYDRTYTPLLYSQQGAQYIPVESVYAVFEVKQNLSKAHIHYAQDKVKSVRALDRTSAPIYSANGPVPARPLFSIVGGLLTYQSDYTPSLSDAMVAAHSLAQEDRLDLGCVAADVAYAFSFASTGSIAMTTSAKAPVVAFFLMLLERLSSLATVPAIDYGKYLTFFECQTVPHPGDETTPLPEIHASGSPQE